MSADGSSVRRFVCCLTTVGVVTALGAGSCARSETLGPQEAVEVMVLDGVDRGRAICVVQTLEGTLDLAKVTGFDVDLTDTELALLSTTSSVCAPALVGGGGVIDGGSQVEPGEAEASAATTAVDVEQRVAVLMEDGLDPDVADCLVARLRTQFEPEEVLDDIFALSAMIVGCGEEPERG